MGLLAVRSNPMESPAQLTSPSYTNVNIGAEIINVSSKIEITDSIKTELEELLDIVINNTFESQHTEYFKSKGDWSIINLINPENTGIYLKYKILDEDEYPESGTEQSKDYIFMLLKSRES
jgi:hypothetical protein